MKKLKSKIEQLDRKIEELLNSKKNITSELQNKKKEIEDLSKEFDNGLAEFPINLNEKILEAKKTKKDLENSLFKIDKTIYGIFGKRPVGLYWKQAKLYGQYKKKAVGNDKLFKELQEESTNRVLKDLSNNIIIKLKQNNLFLHDEMKLNDLCLDVIEMAISLQEEYFYEKDRDEIYDIAIEQVVFNQSKGIGVYIFDYNIEAIKEFLSKVNSNSEKLDFINRQMSLTKRLIEFLKNTKIFEWYGNETFGIYPLDKDLSDLIEDAIKTKKEIFKQPITEDVLKEISEGLKNRLTESFIYLENEYEDIRRQIDISKIKNDEANANKFLHQGIENNSNEKVEDTLTVKAFIDKYFIDNAIQIETVINKLELEQEILSAWNKTYPNIPRKLTSFHRELPRTS